MPYLIRAKGRPLVMRDGPTGPMYAVGVVDWVIFENLPAGTAAVGDADVEVKEVTDESEGVKGQSPEAPKNADPPKKRGRPRKYPVVSDDEESI